MNALKYVTDRLARRTGHMVTDQGTAPVLPAPQGFPFALPLPMTEWPARASSTAQPEIGH